jgi:hypothetical protein
VPVLRSVTNWTTRGGKRRLVRLYGAWKNLHGRISGRLHAGDGSRPWAGKKCLFRDWRHFRTWALANGYSKTNNSLDRFFDFDDYGPDSCRWVTRAQNTLNMTRGVCARVDSIPYEPAASYAFVGETLNDAMDF